MPVLQGASRGQGGDIAGVEQWQWRVDGSHRGVRDRH